MAAAALAGHAAGVGHGHDALGLGQQAVDDLRRRLRVLAVARDREEHRRLAVDALGLRALDGQQVHGDELLALLERVGVLGISRVPLVGAGDLALGPMRALEELDLALGGDGLGRTDHAVVDELLVELERGGQLLDRPGDFVGLGVDHVLAGHLRRHQRDDEERVQPVRLERIVVGPELLVEHRRGCDQVVPSFGDRQAGAVELGLVEEHHPAGGRDVQPVELAVDGPGGEVRLAPLGEVDGAGELVEVGEAVALLAEQRQPRPVDLQDVGLGGAGHLGGELLLEARPAGELGLDGVAVLGAADLQRLLGGGVAAIAAPPRHAQVGGVGRTRREGDQGGEGSGGAKHWEFLLESQFRV